MNTMDILNTLNTFSVPLDQIFDLNSTQHIDLPTLTSNQQIIQLPVLTINQPIVKPISPPKPVFTQPVQALDNASQNFSSNATSVTTTNNNTTNNGNSMNKNTVYKEKMTLKEGVVIQKAFESLRQILVNKKEKLEGLIDKCYEVGKVEYKMTIDSAPVKPEVIVNRLDRYEQKYLNDFRRLLLSNNAMEKLYSELLAGKTIKKVVAHAKMINPMGTSANQAIPSQAHPNFSLNCSPAASPDRTPNQSSLLASPSHQSKPPPTSSSLSTGQKFSSIPKPKPKESRVRSKPIGRPRSKKIVSQTTISPSQDTDTEQETTSKFPSSPSPAKKSPPKKDPVDDKYHCEFCSKAFLRVQSLNIHLEFDHPPSTRMTISSPEGSPTRSSSQHLECKECRRTFLSSILYNIHLKSFHNDKKKPSSSSIEHSYSRHKASATSRGRGIRGRMGKTKRGRPRLSNAGRKRSASEASLSDDQQSNDAYSYREPFFDPEIPLECSVTNPIVLITPLSQDIVDAYRRSIERSENEDF